MLRRKQFILTEYEKNLRNKEQILHNQMKKNQENKLKQEQDAYNMNETSYSNNYDIEDARKNASSGPRAKSAHGKAS